KILSVSLATHEYAEQLSSRFKKQGLRVEVDSDNERIGNKIRKAQNEKIPYMVVIGNKEQDAGNISVRCRKRGDLGCFEADKFIEALLAEISSKGFK
ncbi:MAG: His/Gly/Thr/Pro-type tRNA ligase C-terminal domain-containing protein, partial [Defluviitaleaceae bacterium]|nr:His/Gly/Thr/Pro-type tRNA ligase C-terminal domain-containing protein [Defluviitaleaceae bacterium]